MLNICQGFYSNIGPLKNKSYLLNYKNGKVLVKAPIGTGKSFLFFDGPIFALYKTSDRTIINKDSKKGEVQLLFSVNDNYYLVARKISQTKSGSDSVKTYLYSVLKDKNLVDYLEYYQNEPIVLKNNDILTLLNFYQVKLEDLTTEFKQERELQDNLNELLPPKEVALSTIFLPQNSENIFELSPSARIDILKKVFGILGIDDAKKVIDEKRKEIAAMLKAKEETSSYKDKFNQIFEIILEKRKQIDGFNFGELDELIGNLNDLEENLFDINLDKTQTINVDFESILETIKNKQENILKQKEHYNHLKSQLEQVLQAKKELETKLGKIEQEINLTGELEKKQEGIKLEIKVQKLKIEQIVAKQTEISSKYKDLQSEYENYLILQNNLKNLENEKKQLETESQKIEQQIKKLIEEEKKLQENKGQDYSKEVEKLKKELEELKNIDLEKYTFNNRKVNSLSELKMLFSDIETEGKNLKKQIDKDEENLVSLKKELEELEKEEAKNKKKITFSCEKINAECPFIETIGEKLLGKNDFIKKQILVKKEKLQELEKNLAKLKEERLALANYWKEKNVSSVRKQIEEIEQKEKQYNELILLMHKNQEKGEKLAQLQGQKKEAEKNKTSLLEKLKQIEEKIVELKKELAEKKEIEKDYKTWKNINLDLEKENKKLVELNEEVEKLKDKETIIKSLLGEKKQILEQIKEKEENIRKLEEKIQKLSSSIEDTDLEKLKQTEKLVLDLKEQVFALNELIQDYQKNKLSIINLKQELALYKDLTNIFGKELVIYVFSDYLESLEDLINYFIQDVVNFKLNIKLDEKGENLDIFIEDEKGKRDVKSLSGGQKTALRIGWILGISRLQNSKILFLDETINNFDQESVQMIAKKIKEFVEENEMKFYMITHSEILQQTDIWTDVVELDLKKD